MKKFPFLHLQSLAYLMLCLFLTTPLLAQQANKSVKTPSMAKTATPSCDKAASFYGPDLQIRANSECRTIYPCVDCIEKATGKKICNQVAVHPNKDSRCAVTIKEVIDPKTAQPAPGKVQPLDQNDFGVEIYQSPCYFDGISLRVQAHRLNSTLSESPKDYTYAWSVDNMPMGNGNQVYCVSGKSATVKVTQVITNRIKTKTVTISYGDQTSLAQAIPEASAKPIAGYRKTSCFGSCPSYSVEFFRDGTVKWNGYLNTYPLGQRTAKLPADAMAKLEAKAREIGFLKLHDAYPEDQIADAATTVVYMHLDGMDKQVTDIFGAPEGLTALEKMFDEQIAKFGWAKAKGPAPTRKKVEGQRASKVPSGN